MLGGIYPPELDQVDVAALVEHGGGRFIRDSVVRVDPRARTVHLAHATAPLHYDVLSMTFGSEVPSIPGADGPAGEAVYAAKSIRRLWDLRVDLERRFQGHLDEAVRIVVAGGGATACEVAANIAQLAEASHGRVETTVLVGGQNALGQLPPAAARKVVAALERRGIAFLYHSRFEQIEGSVAITSSGATIPFDIFVNATGLKPASIMATLGLPVDRHGALLVDEHLRSIADPLVHGGGDCIALDGHELPRIGVYAIRQAPVLFHNLLAALESAPPIRFTPQRRFLWIMNLGDGTGLAMRGRLYWHGRLAFWLKDRIDRRFLQQYQHLQ
jgi:NADH dehydrogenase FAD-containing subunit